MDQEFLTSLVRATLAEAHFQSSLIASREMFGRSYFSLGASEKSAVDQAVFGFLVSNYQAITPEFLASQQAQQPDPRATQFRFCRSPAREVDRSKLTIELGPVMLVPKSGTGLV